jgi:hypothetical protein
MICSFSRLAIRAEHACSDKSGRDVGAWCLSLILDCEYLTTTTLVGPLLCAERLTSDASLHDSFSLPLQVSRVSSVSLIKMLVRRQAKWSARKKRRRLSKIQPDSFSLPMQISRVICNFCKFWPGPPLHFAHHALSPKLSRAHQGCMPLWRGGTASFASYEIRITALLGRQETRIPEISSTNDPR